MTPGGEKFTSISNSVGSISDTAQLVLNKKKAPHMANTLTTLVREGHLLCPDNLTTQGQTNMSKLVTTVIPHLLNHQDIISCQNLSLVSLVVGRHLGCPRCTVIGTQCVKTGT